MAQSDRKNSYLTRHLFRAGLGCPTKLYYKANNYPENRDGLPFIAHNRLNKKLFIALARCSHREGVFIKGSDVEEEFSETTGNLNRDVVTLFDAVFIWQNILVNLPIVEKRNDVLTVYNIQTKAFNPDKHRLVNQYGTIYPKWMDYLTDFAFQLYIVQQLYPDSKLNPLLVLPNKTATVQADQLHKELKFTKQNPTGSAEIAAASEALTVKLEVEDLIQSIWKGAAFKHTHFEGKSFGQVVDELKKYYFSGDRFPVSVGSKCKTCEFRDPGDHNGSGEFNGFNECWQQELRNSSVSSNQMVFDLIGPGTEEWVDRELYFQHQVPSEDVTEVGNIRNSNGKISERQRQALQILKAKGLSVPDEIIKPQLFEELKRWEYPIHFLDFEAGNYTIPVRSNRKPYHLVVFQYSCHSLQRDGSLNHYEWIDDQGSLYPNFECVRQLRNIPDIKEGTMVQYSNFERNALKIIRKELIQDNEEVPDAAELAEWINHFISRDDSNGGKGPYLADLSRMVRNYYYNSQMENSLSIKDVVWSVLSLSPYLQKIYGEPYNSTNFHSVVWWQSNQEQGYARNPYSIMMDHQNEVSLRSGAEAMVVYGKILSDMMSESEKKEQIQALLKYCELDTLAMLMLYQHLQSQMET